MSAGFLHLPELPSSPWFPRVLNLVAVLLLASGAAHWTWALIQPPVAPATLPAEAAAIPSAPTSADTLVSAHLFGKADVATTRSLDSIPVSSLNLVLNGIISAGNDSHALISVDGGEQAPFAVGDEVTTGVTLAEIYDDRVIISRGGKKESLLMYEETGGSSMTGLPSPITGPAVVPMGKDRFDLSRSQLQNQLRRPDVLAQARIVPYGGGGFMVRSINGNSIFSRAGLKRGDVIKSINGQALNNYEDAMRILNSVGGIDNVQAFDLEIMRHGKPRQLHYNIQ